MIRVQIDNEHCEPTKAHKWDAGWDLKSNNETFTLGPGDKVKVHTGVRTEIPIRHMGLVVPRSGLGCKYRVGLANTVGVIDSEYRGEIMVNLVNDGDEPLVINKYDRFCQLVIVPVNMSQLKVVDIVQDSTRGAAGFGSSGTTGEVVPDATDTLNELEIEEILEWTEENPSAM